MNAKFLFLIGASIVVNGWLSAAHAAPEKIDIPDVPYDVYLAQKLDEQNSNKELPTLDYGGVYGAKWGMSAKEVTGGMKVSSQLGSDQFEEARTFSQSGAKLNRIQRDFAAGVTDRKERLAAYRRIREQLVAAYGDPTHPLVPEVDSNGRDLYVAGQMPLYKLEWLGSHTKVTLLLSDKELSVTFVPGPESPEYVKP